ncbi:large conductance mechanosensitive channel protein MscL [Streptomyces sp. E11-3]|uniref:large conductance mechanosensitive channel protein MscL n=1 Tax=Streptomyces sp. E11-3 TaxID=3110112 RepID=UPI00398120B8
MARPTARTKKGSVVSEQKKPTVLDGFKAFLTRGNVVDLAVAVVIGAAFTNIVNSVVKGIINPLVGAFGTKDLENYSSCLKSPCGVDPETGEAASGIPIMWGSVLSATLSFLITAAVVYFLMVLPMAKYLAKAEARRKAKEGVHETIEVSELEVLKEIRDTLVAQRGPISGAGSGAGSGSTGSVPGQNA